MDFAVTHRKMNDCPAREVQQRLDALAFGARVPVEPILIDGVVDALGEVGLQFGGGYRQPVEEQHEVETFSFANE